MAAYSLSLQHWQFQLQSRLSDSVEQYNEPPRYRLHRNFAKSIFVVQIYQMDARTKVLVLQTSRNAIEEMTGEKRCLK